MSENEGLAQFFRAYDEVLSPLATAGNVVQLVGRASEVGMLDALRVPTSVEQIRARTGLDAAAVRSLVRALAVTGVAQQSGDQYSLTGPWQALTAPGAYVGLATALGGMAVEGRLLREGGSYFDLSAAERVVYASSVSPNPFSDELVESFRNEIAADPDRVAMARGGRLLELGCGVAGRVLTTLRAMPNLSAVGIELTEDLANEARRRSEALGLSERFEVVCGDAGEFRSDELFDFGFWSQFFFPADARAAALDTLMRCLRPGSPVHSPLGADFEEMSADPSGPAARDFAVWRVVLDGWGVPERNPDQLVAEFEAAGFVDVAIVRSDAGLRVRATRP